MLEFKNKKYIIVLLIIFTSWSGILHAEKLKYPFLDKGIIIDNEIIKLYDSENKIMEIFRGKGKQDIDPIFPEGNYYAYYDDENKIYIAFGLDEGNGVVTIRLSEKEIQLTTLKITSFKIKFKEKVKTLKGITIGDSINKVREIYGEPTYINKTGDITIYGYICSKEEAPNENIKVTFSIILEFKNDKLIRIDISDGS